MTSYWKKGNKPNANDLAAIARGLQINPTWLLLGEGPMLAADAHEQPDEDTGLPPQTIDTTLFCQLVCIQAAGQFWKRNIQDDDVAAYVFGQGTPASKWEYVRETGEISLAETARLMQAASLDLPPIAFLAWELARKGSSELFSSAKDMQMNPGATHSLMITRLWEPYKSTLRESQALYNALYEDPAGYQKDAEPKPSSTNNPNPKHHDKKI